MKTVLIASLTPHPHFRPPSQTKFCTTHTRTHMHTCTHTCTHAHTHTHTHTHLHTHTYRYQWTIMICRRCGRHKGWCFESTKKHLRPEKFYGLSRQALVFKSSWLTRQFHIWKPRLTRQICKTTVTVVVFNVCSWVVFVKCVYTKHVIHWSVLHLYVTCVFIFCIWLTQKLILEILVIRL